MHWASTMSKITTRTMPTDAAAGRDREAGPPPSRHRGSGTPRATAAAADAHLAAVDPRLGVDLHGASLRTRRPGRHDAVIRGAQQHSHTQLDGATRPYPNRKTTSDDHRPPSRGPRGCARAGRGRVVPDRPGDKVGLVGRNGAGKTTMTKILAGEAQPAGGEVTRSGEVGYLPQDPRTGDLDVLARDRILSARGLDDVVRRLRRGRAARWAATTTRRRDKAMRRYAQADAELHAAGGYAAESEAAADRVQPRAAPTACSASRCRHSRADSAAASSWPGSCSPAPRRCCSTSRPTTSTPTPSCGCASS